LQNSQQPQKQLVVPLVSMVERLFIPLLVLELLLHQEHLMKLAKFLLLVEAVVVLVDTHLIDILVEVLVLVV
jgi:hypothetical protein